MFLSALSLLVEACKQGMHSALALLSSRYKQVGSAFFTNGTDEEQWIGVLFCSSYTTSVWACNMHKET